MQQAGEDLKQMIIVNRVARALEPVRLMTHGLRQDLAGTPADLEALTHVVLGRLPTPEDLREKIAGWWTDATADVASCVGAELLTLAPGAEVLQAVFQRYCKRNYSKRVDGVAIAQAMPEPPGEVREVLAAFLAG